MNHLENITSRAIRELDNFQKNDKSPLKNVHELGNLINKYGTILEKKPYTSTLLQGTSFPYFTLHTAMAEHNEKELSTVPLFSSEMRILGYELENIETLPKTGIDYLKNLIQDFNYIINGIVISRRTHA